MMETSEVFLKLPIKLETSGGITMAIACGSTMSRIFCQ
jgi:hypothetical protein